MANHRALFFHLAFIFLQIFSIDGQSETYIVHMDLSLMPRAFTSHQSWFLATLSSISNTGLVYAYTNAIHGFSAVLSPAELEAIKKSPGYLYSIKDASVKVDTSHTPAFLGLSSDHGAWPVTDYGRDVIIGVIDTGVWPESKSFGDDGMGEIPARWKGECESGTQFSPSMCNKKLIGARYFNKGLLARNPNLTISMNSARDTDGHGTHTSSTAAGGRVEGAGFFGYATGVATGIAPKARVAMYKALWDEGAQLSDIVAAIDQALADGVDVLSLSLGVDGLALYEDPIAIAAFAAMEKNVFVSTSAGNQGPYLASLHNGTPWLLTVAAGTVDREFRGTLTLDSGLSVSGLSLYPGNSTSTLPAVFLGQCTDTKQLKNAGDKIVVCLDKNGTVGDQVFNLQNGKVGGGVFITNVTDLEFLLQNQIPSVFLTIEDGEKILHYIKTNPAPKAKLEFKMTVLGTKPAPKVTSYSSRGPSLSCPKVLKPDIMAPGSLILASWPSNSPVTQLPSGNLFSNFNLISGTSMACPHATGVAALLKAAHPDWTPAAIRSAMMTTADATDNTAAPIQDIGFDNAAASPLAMGAGHINPNRALDPGLIYDVSTQDYINLICALNFTQNHTQTIIGTSSYNCSNPSFDLNYPSFIAFFPVNATPSDPNRVQEFRRTLTNLGDGMSVYSAKLTPIDGVNVTVVPDKLVFTKKCDKQSYKLRIEAPPTMDNFLVFGSLTWVENAGKHVVRSPIVATTLNLDD